MVALKAGTDEKSVSAEAIQECCREQLAGYKRPKQVVFIDNDEMPRTASGKIIHRKLQERMHGD